MNRLPANMPASRSGRWGIGPQTLKSCLQAAVAAGVAWVLLAVAHAPLAGWMAVGIAVLIFYSAFSPAWYSVLAKVSGPLAYFVGLLLTWLLLVPIFYLFFFPVRMIFWLLGKDALQRRFDPKAATYWIPCRPKDSEQSYQRQF